MRFALLADCHIGEERPYEGVVRKLSRYALPFIEEIISELGDSVDFVVQLGDLIEDGADIQGDIDNYQAGIAAFARAPVPVLHVFGNHEQVHLTVPQLCAMAGQIDSGAATVLSGLAAAPYYSCMIGGYKLIVLFSSSVEHTDIHVDKEQIDWLKQMLLEGTEPVLVFVHHPLDEQSLKGNVWFEKYPHYCFCEERLELRQILEASKRVLAVFGGHVHQNSVSCINGIYYVTVQSLVERINRDGSHKTENALPSRAYALVDVLKNEAGEHQLKIEVCGNDALAVDVKCLCPGS